MEATPAEESEHLRYDDLPPADELNKRAEALLAQINRHLERRRPPSSDPRR